MARKGWKSSIPNERGERRYTLVGAQGWVVLRGDHDGKRRWYVWKWDVRFVTPYDRMKDACRAAENGATWLDGWCYAQ